MAMLGLVGGPLLCRVGDRRACSASSQPAGALQIIATIPEFLWELSLGIWLTVKGFLPSPVLSARA